MVKKKPNILFICTGNSIRSQMSEAFCRKLGGDRVGAVQSAGVMPSGIHPFTLEVMAELDFGLEGQESKSVNDLKLDDFDYWITLCDSAKQLCPIPPADVHHEHWSIEDPISAKGTDEKRLEKFRDVRDELRSRVEDWLKRIGID